jgi:hypothetical protein
LDELEVVVVDVETERNAPTDQCSPRLLATRPEKLLDLERLEIVSSPYVNRSSLREM